MLGKQTRIVTCSVYTIGEIPAIFSIWSLAHSQNSRMLITFFRSEPRASLVALLALSSFANRYSFNGGEGQMLKYTVIINNVLCCGVFFSSKGASY